MCLVEGRSRRSQMKEAEDQCLGQLGYTVSEATAHPLCSVFTLPIPTTGMHPCSVYSMGAGEPQSLEEMGL